MAAVPNTTFEISDERVSSPSTDNIKILLIGMKLPSGAGAVNTPQQIFSTAEAIAFAGEGSQLVQMVRYARNFEPRLNLTIVAMDAPVAAAATGTLTFAGASTVATQLELQVEDQTVLVPVAIGDTPTDVAAAIEAVLAGDEYDGLHVSASAAAAVLTFTAKSHGEHGNEILFKVKSLPAGITVTPVAMSGGTGAPDVGAAIANLGAQRYNYFGLPDTNSTNLTDVKAVLDDRFKGKNAIDGHGIAAKRDTVGNLATLGLGLDTNQISIFGDPNVPTNPWAQVGVICAARFNEDNPKMSIRDVPLTPIKAPDATLYLDADDRNTLLEAGISVFHYVQDTPRVDRFVTLQKTNNQGQPSDAYFDVETKLTASEIRQENKRVLDPVLGFIWTPDASTTEYDFDVKIIDPEGVRQILITQYRKEFLPRGWVNDPDGYEEDLLVAFVSSTSGGITQVPRINGILYELTGTIEFTN